jgi:isoquinoline 1-oxidoreductase beta subunit
MLKGAVASSFLLGTSVAGWSPIGQAVAEPAAFMPNLFVAIASSGQVTIVVSRSEMGTGIRTSLAMVLADELDADWQDVHVMQAQGDAKYGDQNTDGSKSVRLPAEHHARGEGNGATDAADRGRTTVARCTSACRTGAGSRARRQWQAPALRQLDGCRA